MIIVTGSDELVKSPVQPLKLQPAEGVAVSVTASPKWYDV